jgi:hypothetical protein
MSLYLTDNEVYSEMGRERLRGCKDNDVFGHGAIRAYFQEIFADPSVTKIPHEEPDFSNLEKLPTEIAQNIQDFEKYWGRMWRKEGFLIYDIKLIYELPSNTSTIMRLQKLLRNGNLCKKRRTVVSRRLDGVCKYLFRHKPPTDTLHFFIKHVPNYEAKAKKMLATLS